MDNLSPKQKYYENIANTIIKNFKRTTPKIRNKSSR